MAASNGHATVADLQRIVASLVSERQALRGDAASAERIEANRLALVYWQDKLSHALVAEHLCADELHEEAR